MEIPASNDPRSNLGLESLNATVGFGSGDKIRWCISLGSTATFLNFDLEGLIESEVQILCFPKECDFIADLGLISLVGKADEAQSRVPSKQALDAALKKKRWYCQQFQYFSPRHSHGS